MKKYSSPKLTIVEKTLVATDFMSEFGDSFSKAFRFGGPRVLASKDLALDPVLA